MITEDIDIELSNTLINGKYCHYYNGDDTGLSCGKYFFTIDIGNVEYTSEIFEIKEIPSIEQTESLEQKDLSIELESIEIDAGLYFHYYNGAALDLDCGKYYFTIVIGGITYYSEIFTVITAEAQYLVTEAGIELITEDGEQLIPE